MFESFKRELSGVANVFRSTHNRGNIWVVAALQNAVKIVQEANRELPVSTYAGTNEVTF